MKWVLNTKKGTTIRHPTLGALEGGIAYPIEDKNIPMAKNIINLMIFDGFIGEQ